MHAVPPEGDDERGDIEGRTWAIPAAPAVQAGPGAPPGAGTATFTVAQVGSLQRGVRTTAELLQWFGEPISRTPLDPPSPDGCVQVWTWMRGMSALSVAFGPDGTVCKVATAGPPPE